MIELDETLDRLAADAGLPAGERSAFAEALRRYPPPCVRLRPDVSAAAVATLEGTVAVEWHPRGRLLPAGAFPARSPFYGAGEWYVQDAGSLLADALLNVRPGECVLDLCAAPGGKSTAIAERLGTAGVLVANEPISGRLDALRFNLARHGTSRYVVTSQDPERLAARFPDRFDAVLVDAPCSGQSLVVRGKQALSAFGEAAVASNADRQSRILDAAARLVRPGGRLVYSTCTFAPQENEERVRRFLDERADWSLDPEPTLEPYGSELLAGSYRLWPHRAPTSGAFAARLRRDEASSAVSAEFARRRPESKGDTRRKARRIDQVDPSARDAVERFVGGRAMRLLAKGPTVLALPADFPEDFDDVAAGGPEAVFQKGTTWFPSYSLAIRRESDSERRSTIEVDDDGVRRYLAGESFPTSATGWAVVTYRGSALGWCKADGRTAKNHLPKPGRLLIESAERS